MLHLTLQASLQAAVRAVLPDAEVANVLVRPCPDARHGDYQSNALIAVAKQRKLNPRQFAEQVKALLDVAEVCDTVEISGPGFLNFRVRPAALAAVLQSAARGEHLFFAKAAQPRTVVIDFSSPNVAKPMHVGHIRSTGMGDALQRVFRLLGRLSSRLVVAVTRHKSQSPPMKPAFFDPKFYCVLGSLLIALGANCLGSDKAPITLKGYYAAFSPDGRRLALANARTVTIWHALSGREVVTPDLDSETIRSVAFSPDGKSVASAVSDQTVKIWDAASGQEKHTLKGHGAGGYSVMFSPDGKLLASASSDHTVKLWNVATGKEELTFKGHTSWVTSVVFSPDGKQVASAAGLGDDTVKVWDIATGRVRLVLKHDSPTSVITLKRVAFSPDGKRLASTIVNLSHDKPGVVKVWNASNGRETLTLTGHTDGVLSVAFSPDGKRLASGGHDQTVKVWDATNGKVLQTLRGHASDVESVEFSPDGRRLVSASREGTVQVWDLSP